jgi:hypothetical protein
MRSLMMTSKYDHDDDYDSSEIEAIDDDDENFDEDEDDENFDENEEEFEEGIT